VVVAFLVYCKHVKMCCPPWAGVEFNLTRSSQTSPVSTAAMRRSGVFSQHQGKLATEQRTTTRSRQDSLLHTQLVPHNGRQTPLLNAQTTGGGPPTHLPAMPIPPRWKPNNAKSPTTNTFRPGPSDLPYLDRTQHGATRCQNPHLGGPFHPLIPAAPRIWSRTCARKAIPSVVERAL
jgi:hypothetical protein